MQLCYHHKSIVKLIFRYRQFLLLLSCSILYRFSIQGFSTRRSGWNKMKNSTAPRETNKSGLGKSGN